MEMYRQENTEDCVIVQEEKLLLTQIMPNHQRLTTIPPIGNIMWNHKQT